MDEVIETQELPRRNGRSAALGAGGLLVVVALLPDRADPIRLGLELPDDQVGCAG